MNGLISAVTLQGIDQYLANQWPVLLVVGEAGSGKKGTIGYITDKLGVNGAQNTQYLLVIDSDSSSISIDEVRNIRKWLKLKHDSAHKRVVVIHDAQRLTHEAQNAILKTLEETPEGVHFILGSTDTNMLLDTVLSRAQRLDIVNPTVYEIAKKYDVDGTEAAKVYAMTGGLARYVEQLLGEAAEDNDVQVVIMEAKNLLRQSMYERLCRVDQINKDLDIYALLFALKRVHLALLKTAKNREQITKLAASVGLIVECEQRLRSSSPNNKLLLTNLFMNI